MSANFLRFFKGSSRKASVSNAINWHGKVVKYHTNHSRESLLELFDPLNIILLKECPNSMVVLTKDM